MVDVGLGQAATATGYLRSKALKDAITDNFPFWNLMEKEGGIKRVEGGEAIVLSALTGPNATATWTGEAGRVAITDSKIMDSAIYPWKYQMASVVWTIAEQMKNRGGPVIKYQDIISNKYKAAEITLKNQFQEGVYSNGTGYGGLQLTGLPTLVSTTPNAGVVGGIDRSNANAAWFRNQKFDTAVDWADGPTSPGNIKRFFDKGINATTRTGSSLSQVILAGQTHFDYLMQATQAIQIIQNENNVGKVGFQSLMYRGLPVYMAGGINYSGYAGQTPTRSYILTVEDGGVNIYFQKGAEFDMLEPVPSQDQAAISRLFFTMTAMTIGGLAKFNWVGFD